MVSRTHEIVLNAYELPTQIRYNEPQQLVTSAMHARARATYGLHHMHDAWYAGSASQRRTCAFIRGELLKLACVKCNFLCKFPGLFLPVLHGIGSLRWIHKKLVFFGVLRGCCVFSVLLAFKRKWIFFFFFSPSGAYSPPSAGIRSRICWNWREAHTLRELRLICKQLHGWNSFFFISFFRSYFGLDINKAICFLPTFPDDDDDSHNTCTLHAHTCLPSSTWFMIEHYNQIINTPASCKETAKKSTLGAVKLAFTACEHTHTHTEFE